MYRRQVQRSSTRLAGRIHEDLELPWRDIRDVPESLRSLSMLGEDGSDAVQDTVVTEGDVIWVTWAEKEEI